MIRKSIIGGAVAVLLAGLLFGRDAWSYVSTSAGWVKDSVKSSVPMEFEIERARTMIKNLVPDIQKNMHVIAKEEVEVERLAKQITAHEEKLTADRSNILRLKSDLAQQPRALRVRRPRLHGLAGEAGPGQPLRALQDGRRHAGQPAGHSRRPARRASTPPGRSWKACWPPSVRSRSTWRTWRPS